MINMEIPIQLPAPTRRPSGLFVNIATPIDTTFGGKDRLGSGVVHVPWGCEPVHLGNAELCMMSGEMVVSVEDTIVTDATDLEPKIAAVNPYPDQVIHPPFKVVDGLECSVLSFPHDTSPTSSITNRIRSRITLQLSKMLMAEMVAGIASGGPSLTSEATTLPSVSGVYGAAFQAETWLASVLHNGVGVVVIPVGMLPLFVESGWVDPSTMKTLSGHMVIADAGFTGDVADPTSLAPSTFSLFAMGVPSYAASSPELLEVASGSSHVDITNDTITAIIESYVQLAFDPCAVGEVTMDFSFDDYVLTG